MTITCLEPAALATAGGPLDAKLPIPGVSR